VIPIEQSRTLATGPGRSGRGERPPADGDPTGV